IINSYEYQIFKNKYPKLCELAEKDLQDKEKGQWIKIYIYFKLSIFYYIYSYYYFRS
ncbi:hypothetical protein LCGC14_2915840, partial [marine sediment metagenome]